MLPDNRFLTVVTYVVVVNIKKDNQALKLAIFACNLAVGVSIMANKMTIRHTVTRDLYFPIIALICCI